MVVGQEFLQPYPSLGSGSLVEQLFTTSPLSPLSSLQETKGERSQKNSQSSAAEQLLFASYRALKSNYPQLKPEQRQEAVAQILTMARENPQSPLLPYIYYLIYYKLP